MSIANRFCTIFRDNLSEIMSRNVSILMKQSWGQSKTGESKPLLNMPSCFSLIFNTGIFLAIFSEMMDKTVKLQGYTNEIFGLPLWDYISIRKEGSDFV